MMIVTALVYVVFSPHQIVMAHIHSLFSLILLLFLEVNTSFMCALVFLWLKLVPGSLRPLALT